ncbi:MAG TPA: hypothetical protein VGL11_23040, partial [Candidatus Binatia bacterium]
MKQKLRCVATLGMFVFAMAVSSRALAQVPEIPNPNLPDIAMVQPHPQYGAVIIYNPLACQQLGLACGFFRAH